MSHYLNFEEPLRPLDNVIDNLSAETDITVQQKAKLQSLMDERDRKIKKIFSNLSSWQKVQLARHPQRPYAIDYIDYLCPNFIELHGDRNSFDDPAVVTGFGKIDTQPVAIVAQQKGRNTKENLYRNFGMMRPEGYRKALRVMKLAEKFNLPIVCLIDTPGAYPGIGAEERGQGHAIAKNIKDISSLNVPIIALVIGEGASGGALGIGICDRFIMMENTWFSVISPEGCASILWHDATQASAAAEALRLTPEYLFEYGICDKIIKEPIGGAHRKWDESFVKVKNNLLNQLKEINNIGTNNYLDQRINKYNTLISIE
ncbi:MAG: acetyl-CoA carboxylase carboxyl transferase subunit alpha [Candidatus Marinimicrobia bacterium]|nr:acetyl-CoA carboxylase carboxyl transferase subunit alpha [Candidatus Neomarinimicrobiota bacterium]